MPGAQLRTYIMDVTRRHGEHHGNGLELSDRQQRRGAVGLHKIGQGPLAANRLAG